MPLLNQFKIRNRKVRVILRLALVFYLLAGIALYFFQEKLLFHSRELPADHAFKFSIPFRELNLAVTEEKNLSIIQFTVPDSICKGVVLYFHGNRRNVERYAEYAPQFTSQGYEVWMMDYPGFGKTTGKRSEQVMYNDATELYRMALARYSKDSIVIYGKSLGTGLACYLGSRVDCRRVILETPYTSIEGLFNHYAFIYPVSWMAKYHFPNDQYIKSIDAPVTIFHGTCDGVIPFSQARRLFKSAKAGTELISIEKGIHNNLSSFPLYQHKLDSLLK